MSCTGKMEFAEETAMSFAWELSCVEKGQVLPKLSN